MIRIGLDLDDTINYWWDIYLKRFGKPVDDTEVTYNVVNVLKFDRDFWESLPVKNRPEGFEPALYCTARVNNKRWTKHWLEKNGFPKKPVYQRFGYGLSKAPMIKGRVDVFIDDSPFNVFDLNQNGIPCLMLRTPQNEHVEFKYKINTLNYDEIIYQYNKIKLTLMNTNENRSKRRRSSITTINIG